MVQSFMRRLRHGKMFIYMERIKWHAFLKHFSKANDDSMSLLSFRECCGNWNLGQHCNVMWWKTTQFSSRSAFATTNIENCTWLHSFCIVQLNTSEASSSLIGNGCKTWLLACVYELNASHCLELCMLEVLENWTTFCLHDTKLKVVWFVLVSGIWGVSYAGCEKTMWRTVRP